MDKRLLNILFLLSSSLVFGQLKAFPDTSKLKPSGQTEIVSIPDVFPEFPGGFKKLNSYIMNLTNKITITKNESLSYKTPVLSWTIDKKGNVTKVKMIQSSNISRLDKTLMDGVQKMPKWTPAKISGHPVEYDYRFPVRILFK